MENFIGNPTLPGDGSVLKKIVKIIKTAWNILTNKPAKDASQTDSVNDNSSLDNIDRITEIFSDFKEQVYNRSLEIEKAVKDEVAYYLDELCQLITDNQGMAEKYGIRTGRIKKKIDRILLHLDGVIGHEISRQVSLDNGECKNIMKMIPGEKKEKALQSFLDSAIQNALDIYCTNMRECLDEIFEEVNEETIGAVDSIQRNGEILLKRLESVDADNYRETTT